MGGRKPLIWPRTFDSVSNNGGLQPYRHWEDLRGEWLSGRVTIRETWTELRELQ